MKGYPALVRFSSSGAPVPITVVDGLTVNLSGPPTQPPSVVTLTSGQQAEFTFEYSDVPTGNETPVRQLERRDGHAAGRHDRVGADSADDGTVQQRNRRGVAGLRRHGELMP